MELITTVYIITAFVWAGMDLHSKDPSPLSFLTSLGKFVGFPYFVLKEKYDQIKTR